MQNNPNFANKQGYNQYDLNFKIILVGDSGKRKIKKFIKKFI